MALALNQGLGANTAEWSVLTVSEMDPFSEREGMINFFMEGHNGPLSRERKRRKRGRAEDQLQAAATGGALNRH